MYFTVYIIIVVRCVLAIKLWTCLACRCASVFDVPLPSTVRLAFAAFRWLCRSVGYSIYIYRYGYICVCDLQRVCVISGQHQRTPLEGGGVFLEGKGLLSGFWGT